MPMAAIFRTFFMVAPFELFEIASGRVDFSSRVQLDRFQCAVSSTSSVNHHTGSLITPALLMADFKTAELVATRARRVDNAAGQFAGVVATDLSLQRVNQFLKQLALSANGVALGA